MYIKKKKQENYSILTIQFIEIKDCLFHSIQTQVTSIY